MRKFKIKNDPIYQRAGTLSGWFALDGVGFTNTSVRVITYGGISLLLLILCLPYFMFDLDLIASFKLVLEKHGTATVLVTLVVAMYLHALLHESIHILFHPDRGCSDKTLVGMNAAMIFVMYDGPMTKAQMYRMLLAPAVTIASLQLLSVYLFPFYWPVIIFAIAAHAVGCIGDIYLVYKISRVKQKYTELWNCYTALMAK